MIEWNEYVKKLLTEPDDIDGITLSFDSGKTTVPTPPIVKISILMLDKMIENQGNKQIIVFPERQQTALVFLLAKVIHNILVGKIEKEYEPERFSPGEKLKLGNAVVEYLGIEERQGVKWLCLHMADLDKFSTPISTLPMLQKTDTKRPLNKTKRFIAERKRISSSCKEPETNKVHKNTLMEYKTHMASSVYYVSSIAAVKEQMRSLRICDNKASDLLLMSQINYEGKITNIGAGQLSGVPAIVLASDLYAVNYSLEQGNPVHSIMVDVSNIKILEQIDAIDRLLGRKIPIVLVADTANSFDFEELVNRRFNIWRWNGDSLTSELYDVADTIADKRIGHCARQKLQFIKVTGNEISESAKILAKNKKKAQEYSAPMIKLYDKLCNISFGILRETIPLDEFECNLATRTLDECQDIMDEEKTYLSEEVFWDYTCVIQNYRKVYSRGYNICKHNAMCDILCDNKGKKITIVIPEKTDKGRVEDYWKIWINRQMLHIDCTVCFPAEYYSAATNHSDLTIIVGWLGREIMRKVIFSYNTESYITLLYECENRWMSNGTAKWSKSLGYSNNKETIQHSLSDEQLDISVSSAEAEKKVNFEDTDEEDELEEMKLTLRENKNKQFINSDPRRNGERVEAVPIYFVGGFFAFYQKGHKLVSVSQIIMNSVDQIETVLPENLSVGDFIVVRESGRDIVKDMADLILRNSNRGNSRELASKWREVIKIELLFITKDDFCRKMALAGCKKGAATIKNWIDNEDMIAPQERDDLHCIADVTDSEVLRERLDDIFDAANIVRNAHKQAGRALSNQLKMKIIDVLKNRGYIDPFNFWEPIEIEVEGIGIVKVLKVIDKGNVVYVDSSNTNYLIEE